MRDPGHPDRPRRIAGRWLIALWIALVAAGFTVQTTNAFGSVDGEIAWMAVGSLGFLTLLAFGAARLINWLLDGGGLPGAEAGTGEPPVNRRD